MKNNEVPLPKNDGKHRKWLYEIELLYANFELHRPAFMTLEPIRWLCSLTEKLRNDEYFEVQQQHHRSGNKHTTWHESNSFG